MSKNKVEVSNFREDIFIAQNTPSSSSESLNFPTVFVSIDVEFSKSTKPVSLKKSPVKEELTSIDLEHWKRKEKEWNLEKQIMQDKLNKKEDKQLAASMKIEELENELQRLRTEVKKIKEKEQNGNWLVDSVEFDVYWGKTHTFTFPLRFATEMIEEKEEEGKGTEEPATSVSCDVSFSFSR